MLERLIVMVAVLTTMPAAAGEITTHGHTAQSNRIETVRAIDAGEGP